MDLELIPIVFSCWGDPHSKTDVVSNLVRMKLGSNRAASSTRYCILEQFPRRAPETGTVHQIEHRPESYWRAGKRKGMLVEISQLRSVTCQVTIWDHTMLPAIRHKRTHPTLQASTQFTYPGGREG